MDSQVYAGIYRIHSIFVSVSVRPQSHHNPVIYVSKYMWETMQAHTKLSGIPDRWVTSISLVCWLLPSSLTFVNCAIIVCKRRREGGRRWRAKLPFSIAPYENHSDLSYFNFPSILIILLCSCWSQANQWWCYLNSKNKRSMSWYVRMSTLQSSCTIYMHIHKP